MKAQLCAIILAVVLQWEAGSCQRQWVSPQTTAQDLWNPSTWYSPYYQAAAEAYAKFYQNAQDIRNQLWQQAYATGAFGNGGGQPSQPAGGVAGNQPQNWG